MHLVWIRLSMLLMVQALDALKEVVIFMLLKKLDLGLWKVKL